MTRESNGESVGSLCGVSESKSVGNTMGESVGESVVSPWGVFGEVRGGVRVRSTCNLLSAFSWPVWLVFLKIQQRKVAVS